MITLLIRPHIDRKAGCHIDRFDLFLDGKHIVTTRQPLLDGARELLRRGHSPHDLMTTRAHNRNYDNFKPAPIGGLSALTVSDGDRDGLRVRKYEAHPEADSPRGGQPALRGKQVEGSRDTPEASDAVPPVIRVKTHT